MISYSGLSHLIVKVSRSYAVRHIALGSALLDEGSARHRDLYLIIHNTHKRQLCPRRDSNPQSHEVSGRRPTPWTARPPESATVYLQSAYFVLAVGNIACLSRHRRRSESHYSIHSNQFLSTSSLRCLTVCIVNT